MKRWSLNARSEEQSCHRLIRDILRTSGGGKVKIPEFVECAGSTPYIMPIQGRGYC